MGQKTTQGIESTEDVEGAAGKKKLDLSMAQIAGSSLATVAAALLASQMGVYGTILGAGVVSVVATAGGPVIQHFFKRTGDQLRETARPRARQVPVPGEEVAGGEMAALPPEEFGEPTVHGTRVRGWKRTAVASGVAFAIALGGLGAYEAVSGTSISSGGGTIWSGGTRKAGNDKPAPAGNETGTDGKKDGKGGKEDGKTPESGTSPSPSHSHGGRSPSPDPSPSTSGGPKPDPTPLKPTPTPTPPASPAPDGSAPDAGQQGRPTPS